MEESDDRRTMADVSHSNPYTGSTLGDVFRRGPAIADGGEAGGKEPTGEEADDEESIDEEAGGDTMADVDHTPDNEDVHEVWARGRQKSADESDEPGADR